MAGPRNRLLQLGLCFALSAALYSQVSGQAVINCVDVQNVTNAVFSMRTATSMVLQWGLHPLFPSSCVQQFAVCWQAEEDAGGSSACQALLPTATSVAMSGLQPCTTYIVRVTVKTLLGASSTAVFGNTTGADGATNVTVSRLSSSSLNFTWRYDSRRLACVSRFVALVCDSSGQAATACRCYPAPPANDSYSVAVLDLQPCRVFHLRVLAEVTGPATAAVSSPETAFYLDGVAVTAFNATEVGSSSLTVGWTLAQDPPAPATCQHTLVACAEPLAEGRRRCAANVTSPANTTATITNLRPCAPYQLRLGLTTPGGESTTLGPVQHTYSTDRRLVASLQLNRSRDQLHVRWTPLLASPACAKGYRVCWNETAGAECVFVNSTTTSFTILDLDIGAYVVEVAGVFFDDSLSNNVTRTARISGTARHFVSPIILALAIASGKALQLT
ncbi:uncharacterized protein LOC134536511 [Bacillus rossius redtenbacheri]|uniref:uncharacterized protein LOC134536511 n=1 Tax=Bacillus rossius redtenbacheri TaxID=93214 RepID=UPI002FDE0803